jgi:uncharacterized membrane protein
MTPDSDAMTELEIALGRLLSLGVKFSSVALTAGLLMSLLAGAGPLSHAFLTAGVVLLIATPFARVLVSFVAYLLRRDWTFAVLTLIVLGELVASIVAAIRSRA